MERQRKIKILALIAMSVAVLGLTVAFAFISTSLKINGSGTFKGGEWDVHFDNLSEAKIIGDAKEVTKPQITDGGITLNNLNVSLLKPLDKIVYTVDVVNSGKMTAEISSISMTQLTEEQAKYIKFEAKYSNGNDISQKDVLKPEQKETVTITIEYRREITVDQAPKEPLLMDLNLTINYVQGDDIGGDVPPKPSIDPDSLKLGDEVCLDSECFYVMSTTEETVTMLSKYNLNVGNNKYPNAEEGIQNENVKGLIYVDTGSHNSISYGTVEFSQTDYWFDINNTNHIKAKYGTSIPAYVYDSNSALYTYVQNYQNYLRKTLGKTSVSATLMSYEQATYLGCDANITSCKDAPIWVYDTSYWLGSVGDAYNEPRWIWNINYTNFFSAVFYSDNSGYGIRPVITIDKTDI